MIFSKTNEASLENDICFSDCESFNSCSGDSCVGEDGGCWLMVGAEAEFVFSYWGPCYEYCDGNEVDCAGVCGGNAENCPDWQDDPGAYEFVATISGGIVLSDTVNVAEEGDLFGAFGEDGTVRGTAVQRVPFFGPYEGEIVYEMTLRSNAEGDLLHFKYYVASEDAVLNSI